MSICLECGEVIDQCTCSSQTMTQQAKSDEGLTEAELNLLDEDGPACIKMSDWSRLIAAARKWLTHESFLQRGFTCDLRGYSPAPTEHAPGHTDLMVTPESIDAFLEANPPPAEAAPMGEKVREMMEAYASARTESSPQGIDVGEDIRRIKHLKRTVETSGDTHAMAARKLLDEALTNGGLDQLFSLIERQAAEIERLEDDASAHLNGLQKARAEIERLREALQSIASCRMEFPGDVVDIARSALHPSARSESDG